MVDRSHLSIGEVLSLLRDEFPDVTISKIRFLESQGLVDPERTPSGYRKFYDHDVDRLRWILRQQRENFLPLKVIKGRLSDEDTGGLESTLRLAGPDEGAPALASPSPAPVVRDEEVDVARFTAVVVETATAHVVAPPVDAPAPGPLPVPTAPDVTPHSGSSEVPIEPVRPAAAPSPPPGPQASPPVRSEPPQSPLPSAPAAAVQPVAEPVDDSDDDTFTLAEIGVRSGLETEQVEELSRFGLLSVASRAGGLDYYDREALSVAVVAAGFARHGIEARHLRAWRNAAEREVSLFEQIVIPQLRQRNPQARAQATETLDELADLGQSLRSLLVRRGLRQVR